MNTILKWAGNKSRVMLELLAHLPEGADWSAEVASQ